MIRNLLLSLVLAGILALSAGPASAANSLHKNALAMMVEASSSPLVGLKWNLNEANALTGAIRLSHFSDGGSQTDFALGAAFTHYLRPADFSPYAGGSFPLTTNDATDWTLRGFIGVEAFLMSNASVSGDLGLSIGTEADGNVTVITTGTSALRVNLYFN